MASVLMEHPLLRNNIPSTFVCICSWVGNPPRVPGLWLQRGKTEPGCGGLLSIWARTGIPACSQSSWDTGKTFLNQWPMIWSKPILHRLSCGRFHLLPRCLQCYCVCLPLVSQFRVGYTLSSSIFPVTSHLPFLSDLVLLCFLRCLQTGDPTASVLGAFPL